MAKKGKNSGAWWKHWFIIELYKAIAVFIVTMIAISIFLKTVTRHNRELEVPDLSGLTIEEATLAAKESSLKIDVTDSVFIPRMARGTVFRQNPHPGSMVKKNRRILITINSIAAKKIKMPSITGYSLRQAKAELNARQLHVGKLIYVSDIATNNVIAQKYNGKIIAPGTLIDSHSEIDLEVGLSSAQEATYIPNVTSLPLITAKDLLIDNSLNTGRIYYDESIKNISDSLSGFVYKQVPEPSVESSVPFGSRVDLFISIDKSKLTKKE